ncbi:MULTISPECIES: peptidylprolyl isomerase [unclassified Caballeronia]|uniref:peptidylprolyl isomerase n=1 Tax=unclassified Caballeronia TaxID=2646786 RepID=UPI00285B4EFB|nr:MULTISPECIES: peptidylprolyl isomerase [unclassified Caballeronia]MDR5817990.1 peptidylprolyl isomerase [Caballeronia sp. LZ033]MDR5824950.1 peptidylprolyl isomerase [Caballeronia sp. LZ043]MDR5838751.1 peptidylprolyl isomerase [Caballeronia sp. LZ034LL]MDR5882831.1 peptidylprolyl isomerase [Caballeronia sp. LZ032]
MTAIVRIDDEVVDVGEFLRSLKLSGQFDGLIEQLVRDKLTVRAARKTGVEVSDEEIQNRADQFRRIRGLHRAADMNNYLDALHVSLDEFEVFITDSLYQEKMLDRVGTAREVEEYFQLNSPRFDSIEVSHILLDTEGSAKEMISYLNDDPDSFAEMAREHSLADTRDEGGRVGRVMRGQLKPEIEAKVFNAEVGDLLGPFVSADGTSYEIFAVTAKYSAQLDDDVTAEIRRLLREEWMSLRAQEHVIEAR